MSSFTRHGAAVLLAVLVPGAAAAGEFRIGEHVFTLPDGFEIERVAGPPLVDRPISAAFDEEGRLYVTDSAGVNYSVHKQLETKPHRVVRLVDGDGDGRYDESTVFADAMMFPEGALWFDGSLYVAAPPSIWKLTDRDGDGVADEIGEWFQGKTLTGCANDLHGPYAGPDGWIYWAKGAFAEQKYERPGKKPFVTRAAHIFRRRPEGGVVEAVMTGGMDNPVDVVFTPEGERIFTTTFFQHPGGGRRDGLVHAIYGGVYGKPHGVLDGHPRTGDLMPVLTHMGPAAPCGLERYTSSVFGEDFRNNLFAALFNLRKVTRHVLEEDGATFRTKDSDFVVSDNRDFHPTDVVENADGSLLVIDTGGWYKICCPTSQLSKPDVLGAIYRVRRSGAAPADDPRGRRIEWERAESSRVARLLDDPRPAVRRRAVSVLAERGDRAVPLLADAARSARSAGARRNAVWALTRIDGSPAREAVRATFGDADDSVRQAAAHSAAVRRDAGALPALLGLLEKGSPPLRRAAAEAIGRLDERAAVPALLEASDRAVDRVLEHSITYALIEIADPIGTSRGLAAESPRVRRAAFIALDQMEGGKLEPEVAASFLASPDPELRRTASWIVSRRPEWGADLAAFLSRRVRDADKGAAELGDLEHLLARLSGNADVQGIASRCAADPEASLELRRASLRAMARAGLKEAPSGWVAVLSGLLADTDGPLVAEAVAAARKQNVPADRAAALTDALLVLARDASQPAPMRTRALAAIPGGSPLDPSLLEFLIGNIDASQPVLLRMDAAGVLSRAKLGAAELLELARSLRSAGPMEVNRLFTAFEKVADEKVGLALVAALEESPGAAGLRVEDFRAWLDKAPASIRARGEELLAGLVEDADEQRRHLDELAATLPEGDVRRGQKVFNDPKAACASCHAIGYLGGRVGPDLTRIGQVRSERDLLESLVYPSLSFVRSYEPVVVISRKGEIWSGIPQRDAPDELVLATGPETRVSIPREIIAEIRPGNVSTMPAGLTELLTPQELADLLAFLKATRWR